MWSDDVCLFVCLFNKFIYTNRIYHDDFPFVVTLPCYKKEANMKHVKQQKSAK